MDLIPREDDLGPLAVIKMQNRAAEETQPQRGAMAGGNRDEDALEEKEYEISLHNL